MSARKDVLFVANSFHDAAYTRHRQISDILHDYKIDILYLDSELKIVTSDDVKIFQLNRWISLGDYRLIVYWPSSYQYIRARLGYASFEKETLEFSQRSWQVLEDAIFFPYGNMMLNDYFSAKRAANKALVFLSLRATKFPFPLTIFTNSVHVFEVGLSESLIIKNVTDTNDIDDDFAAFPFRLSASVSEADFSGAPFIVQEEILADREVRAYCFDGRIALFEIDRTLTPESEVDVRLQEGEYMRCIRLEDSEINSAALQICQILSLRTCSIDFIRDGYGKLYTLDVNPHGTWHWLQPDIAHFLDCEFADCLRLHMQLER